MISDRPDTLAQQAIAWHMRLAEGGADDWAQFVEWLEADPAHGDVYDQVEQTDEDARAAMLEMGHAFVGEPIANDNTAQVSSRPRRWWIGGAVAASIAAVAVLGSGVLPMRATYEISTAAGESRTISLTSGDRIVLNGTTQIMLDRNNPRFASLDHGEAVFDIRHDPDDPFVLYLGEDRIEDVGTVFNVTHERGETRIGVAEGAVLYNPDSDAVTLTAGQLLHDPGGDRPIIRRSVATAAVGAWQQGRLSYDRAPYSEVVSDLARATGRNISLDPALANREFTGTIRISQDEGQLRNDVADLLDVTTTQEKAVWRLTARTRGAR